MKDDFEKLAERHKKRLGDLFSEHEKDVAAIRAWGRKMEARYWVAFFVAIAVVAIACYMEAA